MFWRKWAHRNQAGRAKRKSAIKYVVQPLAASCRQLIARSPLDFIDLRRFAGVTQNAALPEELGDESPVLKAAVDSHPRHQYVTSEYKGRAMARDISVKYPKARKSQEKNSLSTT